MSAFESCDVTESSNRTYLDESNTARKKGRLDHHYSYINRFSKSQQLSGENNDYIFTVKFTPALHLRYQWREEHPRGGGGSRRRTLNSLIKRMC